MKQSGFLYDSQPAADLGYMKVQRAPAVIGPANSGHARIDTNGGGGGSTAKRSPGISPVIDHPGGGKQTLHTVEVKAGTNEPPKTAILPDMTARNMLLLAGGGVASILLIHILFSHEKN